ncbi:hypothetical protein LTR36_001489 [Oleoguttula mirabilis]|uniref:Uncharacterized protein n=1 Tax=Oleoguttula mirabilis TaxID=1507867 RepID=A0AAV9JN12_9PEZI|nr:hypothetical protein LTR36_001489 [Oleoguttula mirabilis]
MADLNLGSGQPRLRTTASQPDVRAYEPPSSSPRAPSFRREGGSTPRGSQGCFGVQPTSTVGGYYQPGSDGHRYGSSQGERESARAYGRDSRDLQACGRQQNYGSQGVSSCIPSDERVPRHDSQQYGARDRDQLMRGGCQRERYAPRMAVETPDSTGDARRSRPTSRSRLSYATLPPRRSQSGSSYRNGAPNTQDSFGNEPQYASRSQSQRRDGSPRPEPRRSQGSVSSPYAVVYRSR